MQSRRDSGGRLSMKMRVVIIHVYVRTYVWRAEVELMWDVYCSLEMKIIMVMMMMMSCFLGQ